MSESNLPGGDGPATDFKQAVRNEFDWTEIAPSTAVVKIVALAANRDPMALAPLYNAIDPDALDMLLHSKGTNSYDNPTSITFRFDDYQVTAQRQGTVIVRPIEAHTESE